MKVALLVGFALAATVVASTCRDTPTGSTLGQFGREARFPMYYTVAGSQLGEGAIYKINEVKPGSPVEPELVLDGLDFPTGIAVDAAGVVYFAETLAKPDGRVRMVKPGEKAATDFLTDLDFPLGIGIDTFEHLYVLEAATKKVLKADFKGTVAPFVEVDAENPTDNDIGNPRAVTIDREDNLFLVELATNVLSRINPDKTRTVLSPAVTAPAGSAVNHLGDVYLLVANTGAGDGQVLLVKDSATTEVATGLINPLAIAVEATGSLYVAEGDPANRIIRISATTGAKSLIAATGVNPYGIAFTPY